VPVMMRDVALEAVGPESGLRSIVGTGSVRSRPPLELGDMRPYLSVLTVRQRYELRILRNNPGLYAIHELSYTSRLKLVFQYFVTLVTPWVRNVLMVRYPW
jgi:hypothetical protein